MNGRRNAFANAATFGPYVGLVGSPAVATRGAANGAGGAHGGGATDLAASSNRLG
jgi:hypothetical protein